MKVNPNKDGFSVLLKKQAFDTPVTHTAGEYDYQGTVADRRKRRLKQIGMTDKM